MRFRVTVRIGVRVRVRVRVRVNHLTHWKRILHISFAFR